MLRYRAHWKCEAAAGYGTHLEADSVLIDPRCIGRGASGLPLAHMASLLPGDSTWEVIGISRKQWALVAAAVSLGGNVRVGLEDNFYVPSGEMARHPASNEVLAEMVANVWRVLVGVGDNIAEGDTICILKSVKMEIPVATVGGIISRMNVVEGETVQEGDVIAVIE
jgi:acetyl-CoA carboxylase biotin carboxyl carrier protein